MKVILFVPVLAAVLTMIGVTTTHAYATVDCSQSDDPRCQEVTSSPPDESGMQHHSSNGLYCLAGVLLGTWIFPANAPNVPQEAAICQALP